MLDKVLITKNSIYGTGITSADNTKPKSETPYCAHSLNAKTDHKKRNLFFIYVICALLTRLCSAFIKHITEHRPLVIYEQIHYNSTHWQQ